MAKRTFKAGATSQTIDVFIQDSSSTTGAGLSGLVYNSSGLKAYYRNAATGSATAITLATQTVGGAYSSGGFVEIDATNMKGVYRLDLPNAALTSSPFTTVYIYGATNAAPCVAELEIVAYDPFDTVRLGLTALPNVASGNSGAIVTSGTGTAQISTSSGQVILQTGTGTGQLDFTSGVVKANVTQYGGSAGTFASGRPEVNTTHAAGTAWGSGAINSAAFAAGAITASAIAADAIGASELAADAVTEIAAAISIPSAATIADAVWDEATSGHLTAGTFGEQCKTDIDDILTDTGTTLDGRIPAALVSGRMDASVGAMATDTLTSTALAASAASEIATAVLTTAMTEAYASDGSPMTLAQALYMIFAVCAEFSISGTTITAKKLDGSTTAMTFTLDDATNPTARTRAT